MSVERTQIDQSVMKLKADLDINAQRLEEKYPVGIENMQDFVSLYLNADPEFMSLPTETHWRLVTHYLSVLEEIKTASENNQEC